MQHRKQGWRQLIPGLLLVVGLVLTALIILVRVGLGNLPGRKFTMYALTDQARGILRGSDIWLAGQRAGVVADVVFLPSARTSLGVSGITRAGTDAAEPRILLKLAILEERQRLIARDSRAQVRAGPRVLSNPVLHISLGSPGQALIQPGDTIKTMPQFDAEALAADVEQAMALFPLVKQDLANVFASASRLDSLLALVTTSSEAPGARSPLGELLVSMEQFSQRLEGGSFGLFLQDTALSQRMKSVSAGTDSLSRFYNIEESSLGRLVRDTALFAKIDSVAVRFSTIFTAFDTRFNLKTGSRAEALRIELDRLTASLKALRNDARKHPFRYIVF